MASLPPDPWKALGVEKTADKSEIRAAYKKLVLKCHPDKVQDLALKAQKQDEFQKVQQAYELLNDDAERAKYEEQVKLAELRRQAAMMAKNMPNSSASRSSPRHYEIRTAEPRHKTSSTPSGGAKIYAYASVHSRSHEEMPSRYPFDDGEKHARRTASYEKAFRDEDRREKDDRRRRREEDDFKMRERLREKERELKEKEDAARKAEKRKNEKERDRERRRGMEDRHRRYTSPYIEDNESEDQQPYSSKSEKKRSPSNKPYEGRERERERQREKSTTSRRPPSPHVETVLPVPPAPPAPSEPEYYHNLDKAATYIEKSKRGSASSFPSSRAEFFAPPVAPTPPPADADDDLRAAARANGRRSSHEASKSREKLPSSKTPYIIDSSSPKSSRTIPSLPKSHTSPLTVPMESSSPPHAGIHRSSTTQEYSTSGPKMPPTFGRTHTWGPGSQDRHDYYPDDDSEDEHRPRRHRRGSSRRSPDSPAVHTYKVDGTKTTRMDAGYGYGESPNSRRYAPTDAYGTPATNPSYPDYIKVREAKVYTPADVKYSDASYNVSYSRDHYNQVFA